MAKIISINISAKKGMQKRPVPKALLIKDFGLEGDAHAGSGNRQVSLLNIEDIKAFNLNAGDFAENLTIEGIDLKNISVGKQIKIGNDIVLEISQIGKECHTHCAIYKKVDNCIMPKSGIFAKIIVGGIIHAGDKIVLCQNNEDLLGRQSICAIGT